MAAALHNPSRRALLGAAVALPLLGGEAVARVAGPLHPSPSANGPPLRGRSVPRTELELPGTIQPRNRAGEDLWRQLLARYRIAEAAVRDVEGRTARGSREEQFALEAVYGDRLGDLYAALRRLLRVPAPDLPALAVKIGLVIDHEVATLSGGETCLAALRRDALRLGALNGYE